MIELRGYIDERGNKRFAEWLNGLNAPAAAKVTIALSRVILIGGGTKKRQPQDIAEAQQCWASYKRRKKQEIQ